MNEIAITQNILNSNSCMTLSTTNPDGSPWGTPINYAYDKENIYWFSPDNTTHSANIAHDPRIFIAVYSSRQNPSVPEERVAFYLATTAHKLNGDDARIAQDVIADRIGADRPFNESAHFYSAAIGTLDHAKSSAQRLYYRNDESN